MKNLGKTEGKIHNIQEEVIKIHLKLYKITDKKNLRKVELNGRDFLGTQN